jgi:hypothetical protein
LIIPVAASGCEGGRLQDLQIGKQFRMIVSTG